MQDVIEKQEEEELMSQYTRSTSREERKEKSGSSKGFSVKDAPWSVSTEEFPAIGNSSGPGTMKTPSWGPSSSGPKLPKHI